MFKTNDVLNNLSVASPCTASWDDMQGNEQVRFCGECRLNVYNVSALTATEATELIQSHEGRLCIRYYQRTDGTVLTQDCKVGLKKRYQGKVRLRRYGIAAIVTLIALAGFAKAASGQELTGKPKIQSQQMKGTHVVMGDMRPIHSLPPTKKPDDSTKTPKKAPNLPQ